MTHSYPFGAMENAMAVLLAQDKTVYAVHGLGDCSAIQTFMNISEIKQAEYDTSALYVNGKCFGELGWSNDRCYLRDYNIGAHYNDKYLFHDIEDAEAYFEYAKHNTSRPVHNGKRGKLES